MKTELKKINEKSKFLLNKKEIFEEKNLFIEKLSVFSEVKKCLIFDQETDDIKNKLFRK